MGGEPDDGAPQFGSGAKPLHGSVGEYWWSGATGTNFVIDPRHRLVLILLTQQPDRLAEYLALMRNMGYPLLEVRGGVQAH